MRGPNSANTAPTIAKCNARPTTVATMNAIGSIAAMPAAIAAILNGTGVNALAMMMQTPHSANVG